MVFQSVSLNDLFVPTGLSNESAPRVLVSRAIPAAMAASLLDVAGRHSWAPDTILLAAWILVQHHFRGDNEICQVERLASGANKHVLTTHKLTESDSVETWLAAVDAKRRLSRSVLPGDPQWPAPDVASEWLGIGNDSLQDIAGSAAPLSLGVSQASIASIFIDFDPGVLEASQAGSLLESLAHTANNLVLSINAKLGEIDTLSTEQQQVLLKKCNPPLRPYDPAATVHRLLSRQAVQSPDATALISRGERISYGALDARSDALAEMLHKAGVRPGATVCVALERSPDAIVALLAILKAGACYLPVDVKYPADRIRFMLEDASASLAITASAYQAFLPAYIPKLLLDQMPVSHAVSRSTESTHSDGRSVAYIMYTSGSTGLPKGIRICHHSIIRLVMDAKYVKLTSDEAVLHAAPLGFDAATLEIWGPLLNGGRCVIHDEDLPTGEGLARTIQDNSVTTAWLTSSLFNAVVDANPLHLGGLKQLLVGGEALSLPHVRRAHAALAGTEIINGYGPTECTTFTTTYRIPDDLPSTLRSIPIGKPITDTSTYVLSPTMKLLPPGLVGELYVGGRGLALGYLNRDELTSERFVPNPFGPAGERLYRTGDMVRYLTDGNIEFIGRADDQIKLRGYRIELGEIEKALANHDAVRASAVIADRSGGNARLIAYLIASHEQVQIPELRRHLAGQLPEFMIPSAFVWMDKFPTTPNGKLDRKRLPQPSSERPESCGPYQEGTTDVERLICKAFADALNLDQVARQDNFFDLGGDSLLVLKVLSRLETAGLHGLTTNMFFRQPTPAALAQSADQDRAAHGVDARRMSRKAAARGPAGQEDIAIIAMAGRFPGARSVEQFWENLCARRDSITFFKPADLDPSLPSSLTSDPCYVKARGVIEDVEMFDAAFFGISPREAELMDPQQRIFMELCWECLERAGHAPDSNEALVGVFAGMYNATYFQRHVSHRPDLVEKLGEFQVMLANEKDYIATRVANRLNLTGPAISVHTACSTSLVAIAQAFASLRAGQCDMALAGGSSITCPPRSGYLYQDGAMLSPDGHTRSFDANAQGTVFSDGATVVLLKRLSDAIADADPIYAVIKGVAVNNDGREKASFTAPSVDGQAAVIAAAHDAAGIDPRSISYVETHGTATPLGDPVEVEGLTRAFRRGTDAVGFCRIGSVKSNVGHMVIAAGAAGVIKTALSLSTEQLPPSIHFNSSNPKIDFAISPFVVNDELTSWPRAQQPRRAGVSSFGVGGTNAHVVMQEAPLLSASSAASGPQLLKLSARSRAALEIAAQELADHLDTHPDLNLADVAHTLDVGRSRFAHRMCVIADTGASASAALKAADHPSRAARVLGSKIPSVVCLFPGQGAQYAGMGTGLYDADPAFRTAFDDAIEQFHAVLTFDLRARMFEGSADALLATATTQPATFCLQYALAKAWQARGLQISALIGHSVGEYAAAVIAGIMSLRDAARLVARRGVVMQALPSGSMLSVRLALEKLSPLLPSSLSLAAENAPTSCVVAGPTSEVLAFQATLESQGVMTRLLQTSHAFHSSMMDPAMDPFEAEARQVKLSAPQLPIISTLTGTLLTSEQAADPKYWARHLREPVRFSQALKVALSQPNTAFLEVGPRATLTALVKQHVGAAGNICLSLASLADNPQAEAGQMALAQGQLWTAGIDLSAPAASPSIGRRRLLLPTYPFERKRFWIEAKPAEVSVAPTNTSAPIHSSITSPSPIHIPPPFDTQAMNMPANTPAATTNSRQPQLVTRLRALFEDVAGLDLSDVDTATSFIELGLDSLTLTQAALQVKKQFAVALTFRQLMEQYRSFDTLAKYLDGALPAEPATAPAAAVAPAAQAQHLPAPTAVQTAFTPLESSAPLVQQVIQQQMQLMAQQLALLSGVPAQAAQSAPVPAAAPQTSTSTQASALPESKPDAAEGSAQRYDVKKAFGAIARIHTQPSEVTERQKARLQAFMRRYVERTKKSKAYTVENRTHLADPRVVNGFRPMTKEITYQIVIERSRGSHMWDIDGNEYVDTLNGFGMNLFGWQPDFIQDAVRKQLDAGYEIGPQHPLAGDVAKLMCELTGFDRAGLCNTGSEAVMAAIRIARTVTGRSTVVLFTGSYHGTFDEVLVRAGRAAKGIPAAPGIMSGMFGDVRVLDYGTPESLEFIRENADDLAAVLVEPVQSRRPDFQPREFLKEVRAITEKSGTCLIFDEVITGFRAHLGGTQALFGIRADLASYGKVIGGGFPIGVVAGKRDFMDALDGGPWQYGDDSMPTVGVTYFAGTFVRHPLALAAAKASLEHLKAAGHDLQKQLSLSTAAMADELSAFCREVGAPLEIRHFSSLWRVSWQEDHPLQDLLFAMMRSRGVHILDNFPCFMTTAHTPQDIAIIKSAFKESVAELQESEFLPRRAGASVLADTSNPPVPNAKLGRDKDGKPAWFVPDANAPGKFLKVNV